ncbi:MAG: TlpA family protein disulfide reductase [Actinomycetota bacterium]|nr:TlpA family protein disulfide reductase [Actinomycetota bacterium]
MDTAGLDGQVTVLNFWASWCDPCRAEMPMLNTVAEQTGDTVRFLGVNTKDDPEAAGDFLKVTGVGFEQVYDPDGELLRQLRTVQGLPVTLVLDADGAVRLRHIGQIDETTLTDALEPPP